MHFPYKCRPGPQHPTPLFPKKSGTRMLRPVHRKNRENALDAMFIRPTEGDPAVLRNFPDDIAGISSQSVASPASTEVLIVGGGPAGLAAALPPRQRAIH